jgi:hypothetical protein
MAGAQAAGTAAALIGGSLRYLGGDQTAHAGRRIELGITAQSRVDDHAHALDGEAGLRNAGGEHDFALSLARARSAPRLAQRRSRSPYRGSTRTSRSRPELFERALHPANLGGAGQKAQDVALVLAQRGAHDLCSLLLQNDFRRAAPRTRVVTSKLRPRAAMIGASPSSLAMGCISRVADMTTRRKILAQVLLALDAQREAQVGIQTAFVELIEDHAADARQCSSRPAACA